MIPESHRPVSLAKLHTSHLGKTKTTLRARMCVFWPGISKDIAKMIEKCEVYHKYQDKQPQEQITSPPIPNSPWHTIASDLFEFRGKTNLIVSDRYSKFIIVHKLPDHSTEHTIRAFHGIFCEHDIVNMIEKCEVCHKYQDKQPREQITSPHKTYDICLNHRSQ